MASYVKPITEENFPKAEKYARGALTRAKKKTLLRKIAHPLGTVLFTFFSFILVYGAFYTSGKTAEDIEFFAKFGFLTKVWEAFSGLFVKPDMKPLVAWLVLVAAVYIVPLLCTALISIILSIIGAFKKKETFEGDTKEKAIKLHSLAKELVLEQKNEPEGGLYNLFRWIFVILSTALIVYGIIFFKEAISTSLIIGMAICVVIVFFLYGLLIKLFSFLNCLFFIKTANKDIAYDTEEFWVANDPEEQKRRKEEKERKEKEEAEKKKRAAEKAKAEAKKREAKAEYKAETKANQQKPIDKYDSFTWTYGYVRDNEQQCSNIAISTLNVSKELLAEGDYSGAAAGFDKVVRALELLQFIDADYYQMPLFANSYALSMIFAFGLNNRTKAIEYAEKAIEYAEKQSSKNSTAARDLVVMKDFCSELKTAPSLSAVKNTFDIDFPSIVLEMN